jgi:S-adenosylmethionine decarboxylase
LAKLGIHCILELYDCPPELLNDEAYVKQSLRTAVDRGLSSMLQEVSHRFHPQGVTALGLLAESHISIHTWPEFGYAAADVFTCGDRAQPENACRYLVEAFRAGRHTFRRLARGAELGDPLVEPLTEAAQALA